MPDPACQTRRSRGPARAAPAAGVLLVLGGCSGGPDASFRVMMDRGEYARAAARVERGLTADRSDRGYMLDRMRLGVALMADGRPHAAEPVMQRSFEVLRTQGINDDRTVSAAVFGEGGVIFWKGEPFEQALMFHYIALQQGLLGAWDNARAAAQASLFLLKDFGENERGGRRSTREIAERAYRDAARTGDDGAYERYLDSGYTPVKTDFALGHFMSGVANLALSRAWGDPDRENEARDHFREAAALRPELAPLADGLLTGRADTLLVIDDGPGPEKVRYGPDGALARFVPRRPGVTPGPVAAIGGATPTPAALACDVDRMAMDHSWNNMEDLRRAKSAIGNAMLMAGAITASSDNRTARIVGLALLGAGLLSKLTAGADTRHCEAFPQRVFLWAGRAPAPGEFTIAVSRPGLDRAPLVFPCIAGGEGGLTVRYIRLPAPGSLWADGSVRYASDACGARVPGDDLPWILGGRCVRRPSWETLRRYQSAGRLTGLTVADLENLYRAEGIRLDDDPRRMVGAVHILEGGDSLDAPEAGSAGFVRLFCREHPPYSPRSREVREAAAQERDRRAAVPPAMTH